MPLVDPEARKKYRAEFYKKNKERLRAQIDKRREEKLAEINARRRELWAKDREKNLSAERARAGQKRAYYFANKEKKHKQRKARMVADPGRFQAIWAKRHAAKKCAIPKWANLEAVAEVYRVARAASEVFSEPFEVDHIVPLQSLLVCGLHWEANLRVIPRTDNKLKSNRVWPDMP